MSVKEKDQHEFRGVHKNGRSSVVLNYEFFKCRETIADMSTSLAGYALLDQFYMEYEIALCEYFENRDIILDEEEAHAEEFFHDENEFSRFMSWFCTYHIGTGGKTFPESYLIENNKILTDLEKEILVSYSNSYPGLYEVQWVKPGEGLELKDILQDEAYFVHESHFSKIMCKWDLVYGGLLLVKDMYFLSGFDPVTIPPRVKTEIDASLQAIYRREGSKTSEMKDFFRRNSPEIFAMVESAVRNFQKKSHVKNADGDALFFVTIHYGIENIEAFFDRIRSLPFFIQDRIETDSEDKIIKAEYIWTRNDRGPGKGRDGMPQGVLFLKDNTLKARCNSRERAERLKSLFADKMGGILKLRATTYEKPEEQLYTPEWPLQSPEIRNQSSSEDADTLRAISTRHYENWIDEKIPALGNISPREAMGSPQSRQNLIDLLKELENQNERAIRKGIKNADILGFPAEMIRRELGL